MKVFLDANVIVSVINKEYPLFTYSARILSLIDNKKFTIYTSPLCLAIAFYFAEKKSGAAMAKKKIELLSNKIHITDLNEACVEKAIRNNAVIDFEDGLQYYSAEQSKCQCLVTEDVDDFFFSKIEVLRSREFMEHYVI